MSPSATDRARRRRFNFRSFVAFLVVFSFVVMLVSGMVNFLAPSGRVAREVGWTLLALDRVAWQSLHLSFAIVFVVAGVVHIAFNWKGLVHYLRDRTSHHLTARWEAVLALLISAWLAASAVLALPPASNLHDLTTQFRQTFWASQPSPGSPTGQSGAPKASGPPPAAEPVLPPDHPRVSPDKACRDCHRAN